MDAARAGAAWAALVGEACLDVGDAQRVGRGLRFRQKRGALLVGGEHHLGEGLGPARGLLRDPADARSPRHGQRPLVGRDLADDEAEQRRLTRAVAAEKADPRVGRQGDGRVVEQDACADAIGEAVDVQHGALLARRGFDGNADARQEAGSSRRLPCCRDAAPI